MRFEKLKVSMQTNRPFPSSSGPLHQNEVKCSTFDMEIIFHSHANKTHFHKKGCALGLILKVRVLELGSGLLFEMRNEGQINQPYEYSLL